MDYKLAKEIYGNQVWMVDPITLSSMWQMLCDFQNGVKYEHKGDPANSTFLIQSDNVEKVFRSRDLSNQTQDAELIHVLNLDGVITKNGGLSTNGTKYMAQQMRSMDSDSRVKAHVIKASSGGGAGNAIKFMTDAIKQSEKPVISWVEHGDIACSACYGIISASDYIMSESEENVFGSLGTMMSYSGRGKDTKDDSGRRHVRMYATKSVKKNWFYEESMEGNFKPAIEKILDPANEIFLSNIKANRPQITDSQMNGDIFKAGEVIGTLVDGFGSFNDAVNLALTIEKKDNTDKNFKSNNNQKEMNKSELKSKYPELCNEIHNDGVKVGVSQEADRVGSWMAHAETDLEAVQQGIEGGEAISSSQREKFFVKQNKMKSMEDLKNDSHEDLDTEETKLDNSKKKPVEDKESEEAFNFELK